jgi:hypothetical protein
LLTFMNEIIEQRLTERAKEISEALGVPWDSLSDRKKLALKAYVFTNNGNRELAIGEQLPQIIREYLNNPEEPTLLCGGQ